MQTIFDQATVTRALSDTRLIGEAKAFAELAFVAARKGQLSAAQLGEINGRGVKSAQVVSPGQLDLFADPQLSIFEAM